MLWSKFHFGDLAGSRLRSNCFSGRRNRSAIGGGIPFSLHVVSGFFVRINREVLARGS